MSHQPSRIDAGLPPNALALAERGRAHSLVIYAGAGLSLAEPTGLPPGVIVAERIAAQLCGAFHVLDHVDRSDLTAIADAVIAVDGGADALRQTAARVAEFTSARPGYGHRLLALLLLEGVIDILTTNWDDCIERGGGPERVPSVVNAHDLANVVPPSVLKIHGCATQPASLLISTQDLTAPPQWVSDQIRSKLGSAVVVFVGIGDVAGYVRNRLEEAIGDVSDLDNVRVVGPTVVDEWATSQWAQLAPDLAEENKIAATADLFLEQLAGAYVHLSLAALSLALSDEPVLAEAVSSSASAICHHDVLTVLAWARQSGVVAQRGVSSFGSEPMTSALIALGTLAGGQITITRDRTLETSAGLFDVMVSVGTQSASRLRREARNRLENHLGNGAPEPRFLVAGGFGWAPSGGSLPNDIIRDGGADDVLDGPLNRSPDIIRAEEVSP